MNSAPFLRPAANRRPSLGGLHPYAARVLNAVQGRAPWEKEFHQAIREVFASLGPVLDRDPGLEALGILERLVEPERIVSFRVVWADDAGRVNVNRAHRVQFSSALGPYKGGLRFHSSVTLSSLKFLGFEQTFKNALTGLPLGSGKGGVDQQCRGLSDREIMRFCQAFMSELYRHIGPATDVPAGDIGVGAREIGYLFGQYRKLTGTFSGALTGKGQEWGGSRLRPEATGYGIAYLTEEVLGEQDESLRGKTVLVSGFGNVAWGVVKKVTELGGKVVTLSGPDGYIYDPDGVRDEKIDEMIVMRLSGRDCVREYADRFGVEFRPGQRPWSVPCDVAIPCAIENELGEADAKDLVKGGCRWVIEGANMPTTQDAVRILQDAGLVFVPGKAANAGGVAVSGLEMAQNGQGIRWAAEDVDESLKRIMRDIHGICTTAAEEYGSPGNYLLGANIGGFLRVARAMQDQGLV